jgi:hypothetical protein
MKLLLLSCLAAAAKADLRFASRPKESYKLRNEKGAIPFVTSNIMTKYMEPSTFEYQGLAGNKGQKRRNYDQFLRSNIDNEQDKRNFNEDDGKDHLPFRTLNTRVQEQESQVDLRLTMSAGQSKMIPLRWNNPHSSEIEVNIWIFPGGHQPVVVPIKKPTCSGEGYQDNMIKFTIPLDFVSLGSKVPGFTGCNADSEPMCTLQVYAHSVESRTYAYGFPIVVNGPYSGTTTSTAQIQQPAADPGMDLSNLRPLCRPGSDPNQHIQNAVPQWANLFSDVYNHAYQNSDFSPYSGQQHDEISKNLQASAVNKMVTGNRGELGKNSLPQATKDKIKQLQKLENKVYKRYEALANNMIKRLGNQMKETGSVEVGGTQQNLANCFRCSTAGSTNAKRLTTNTYIPSFQLPANLIADANKLVPQKYKTLISQTGVVQIYVAAMNDLMPAFLGAEEYGILYQPAMRKQTLTAMPDATQFKKRTDTGKIDNGKYAATAAKKAFALSKSCPENCLTCNKAADNKRPLIADAQATCVTGQCVGCAALFSNQLSAAKTPPPTAVSIDLMTGVALPSIGVPPINDYPDTDGTPREGRPADPTTTTRKVYYAPPPIGVVGGTMQPVLGAWLLGCIFLLCL